MNKRIIFIGGLLIISISFVALLFCYFALQDLFFQYLEATFSRDGNITCPKCILEIIVLAFLSLTSIWIILFQIEFNNSVDLSKLSVNTKIGSLLSLLVLFLWVFLGRDHPLYRDDNLFEWLTFFLSIASAIILFIAAPQNPKKYRLFLLFAAIACIIFAMEEISWGQRVFDWSTPGFLKTINIQQETNIHNVISISMSKFLYVVFNLILGAIILLSEKISGVITRFSKFEDFVIFLPTYRFTLFGIFFLILSFQSILGGGELSEQMFSLFLLIYSIEFTAKITEEIPNNY